MRWSDERILTTHTGSLPRPPELTRLYVRRARGEAIDRAELDRVGKAALRRIVDKQIEAGVDVGNNGEQQREAFFLYVRHRMSGFGDSWPRGRCRTLSASRATDGADARRARGCGQLPAPQGRLAKCVGAGTDSARAAALSTMAAAAFLGGSTVNLWRRSSAARVDEPHAQAV